MKIKGVCALVTETFDEWMTDNVPMLAAGLAFYALFSLSPLLLILVAIGGAMYGEEAARSQIVERSLELVSPQSTQIIQTALEQARTHTGTATVLGVTGILFGASVVFFNLQHALNTIWSVAPKPGWQIGPL